MIKTPHLILCFLLLMSAVFIAGCEIKEAGENVSVPDYNIRHAVVITSERFDDSDSPCSGDGGWWTQIEFNSFDPPTRAERLHGNKYRMWVRMDSLSDDCIVGSEEHEYVSSVASNHDIVDPHSNIDPSTVALSDIIGIEGLIAEEIRSINGEPPSHDFVATFTASSPTSIVDPDDPAGGRIMVYVFRLNIDGKETVIFTADQNFAAAFCETSSVRISISKNDIQMTGVD